MTQWLAPFRNDCWNEIVCSFQNGCCNFSHLSYKKQLLYLFAFAIYYRFLQTSLKIHYLPMILTTVMNKSYNLDVKIHFFNNVNELFLIPMKENIFWNFNPKSLSIQAYHSELPNYNRYIILWLRIYRRQ